jgi:hypothetical protein
MVSAVEPIAVWQRGTCLERGLTNGMVRTLHIFWALEHGKQCLRARSLGDRISPFLVLPTTTLHSCMFYSRQICSFSDKPRVGDTERGFPE